MSVNLSDMTRRIYQQKLKSRYIDSFAFSCLSQNFSIKQFLLLSLLFFSSYSSVQSFSFPSIHSFVFIHSAQHILHSIELFLLMRTFVVSSPALSLSPFQFILVCLFNCFLSTFWNMCVYVGNTTHRVE